MDTRGSGKFLRNCFLLLLVIVNYKTTDETTPLYMACLRNDPETIGMLLAAGANINERGPNGDTPLMTAV